MNVTIKICLLIVASLVLGCSKNSGPPAMPGPPTSLTVAQWKELPVNEKYDEATFDRLKMQDAKLKDDRTWHRFMIETVIPERKKDLPDDLPG